jgi:hypothetical protein
VRLAGRFGPVAGAVAGSSRGAEVFTWPDGGMTPF